jgi:hypothetical protein
MADGGVVSWLQEMVGQMRNGSARRRRMRLIESLPIGGKRNLLLVDCGGRHFLIGTGSSGVQSIAPVDLGCIDGDEECERSAK